MQNLSSLLKSQGRNLIANANHSTDCIPQIDGLDCTLEDERSLSVPVSASTLPSPDTSEFKCDTCNQTFTTADDFNEHDSYQFCCDECEIWYRTQIESHFHQLQAHLDSGFANTYILESTKQVSYLTLYLYQINWTPLRLLPGSYNCIVF